MFVIGDPRLAQRPDNGQDDLPCGGNKALGRLVRLARRLFGVNMVIIECLYLDGASQVVDGTLPDGDQSCCFECAVRATDGRQLGTLKLLHGQALDLTEEDSQALTDLAGVAATLIDQQHALVCEHANEGTWREEAQKLSMAIAGSGTGVWDRDVVAGEITYSPGWKAIIGYGESELSTRIEDAYERLHPVDRDYVRTAMQEHFDGKTESYEIEHRIRCKDGSYKWIRSRGKVISRDESGRALRMMGTTTNISAVRVMSERLKRTADLVVNLTDAVPGMVFQCHPVPGGGSRFSYVSAGVWDMFELTADDVRGSTTAIEQRIHPQHLYEYQTSLKMASASLTPWHLEFQVCLPSQRACDGGKRWPPHAPMLILVSCGMDSSRTLRIASVQSSNCGSLPSRMR